MASSSLAENGPATPRRWQIPLARVPAETGNALGRQALRPFRRTSSSPCGRKAGGRSNERAPGRVLVIGAGNPLAGADGFGPAVLAALAAGPALAGVDRLDAGTDLLAVLDRLAGYGHVVLVDALLGGGRAGEVVVLGGPELDQLPAVASSAHAVSPLVALRLWRGLHPAAPPRLTLVALRAGAIRLGEPLPAGAVEAGARAVRRVAVAGS
jgi:hydrogenase maturation protease